jgi:DinB superfamily
MSRDCALRWAPVELRLDRVGGLVDQFDSTLELGFERLEGLTDAEWLWEPALAAASVRPRGAGVSPAPYGPGDWQLDGAPPELAAMVRTISWEVGHLTSGIAGRWEWTFGSRSRKPDDLVDFSPVAAMGLWQLRQWCDAWRAGLLTLTDEQLDVVGYGNYPYGLDPELPFFGIIWWVNREVIHHLSAAMTLRDLYAAIGEGKPGKTIAR